MQCRPVRKRCRACSRSGVARLARGTHRSDRRSSVTIRRHYYRCGDCLTPQVIEGRRIDSAMCACGGTIGHIGAVRLHRVVRLEDHAVCDGRCTGATGPSCDCQCGGEHHGSGRVVTVVVADLGAARLTAVDADKQIARGTEFRAARDALDHAVRTCRIAEAFALARAGLHIPDYGSYKQTRHVHDRRSHALALRSHAGRIRALQALTEYVRKL